MRAYKYRGKTVDNKWLFGSLVTTTIGNTKTWIVVSARGNGGWFNVIQRNYVKPDTVGQFTGQYDKNGKMIFEGDIVSIGDLMYHVIFKYSQWKFHIMTNNAYCDPYFYSHADICEVIGNIHDNKDLLKDGGN